MGKKSFKIFILLSQVILSCELFASSIQISYEIPSRPARELVHQGQVYDSDGAIDLQNKGIDLSTLDPAELEAWSNTSNTLSNENQIGYPREDNPVLDYDSIFPAPTPPSRRKNDNSVSHVLLFWARLTYNGQPFRLAASFGLHGSLMRNALLRKLGYNLPSPKYYPRLTVRFPSEAKRTEFLDGLADQLLGQRERFIVDEPKDRWEVTLQDIALEPARIQVPTFHLGIIAANYLEDRRPIRALIVPFSWFDLHESVNMFKWEAGSIISEHVTLEQAYANQFSETSMDDAIWIARRIAKLSREEIIEIVKVGHLPEDVEALVIQKVIARRNHLLKLFKIKTPDFAYDPEINIGNVQNGKLKVGEYHGHAERFIWEDPKSPLTADEVARFGVMMGISAGIGQAVAEVNKNLQILGIEELQKKRIEGLQKNFIESFKKNPFKPYNQPISTWGGVIANGSIDASRNLVTGTYYGTDQSTLQRTPLQLVDQVGVRGSVGYFLGIDGVHANIFPTLSAGLSLQRSYVHVRPMTSVKAALKENWGDIYVPEFMSSLARILKFEETITSADVNTPISEEELKKRDEEMNEALKKFLDKFGNGEVFTITDTISADLGANVRIPLASLLPVSVADFDPAISINGSVGGLVLRRTTITRTTDGVHIYVQRLNSVNEKLGVDLRFWIKFAELNTGAKQGYINTRAYLLDTDFFDPEGKPKEEDSKNRKKFARSMRALFQRNSLDVLETSFSPYVLKHELDATTATWKFLLFQRTALSENHLLRAFPPKSIENPCNPQEHVCDPEKFERDLFATRNTEYMGRRFLPTVGDILGQVFDRELSIYDNPGPNPAYSFFGKSKMTELKTDGEITGGKLLNPVTATIHSWQGWYLSRNDMLKILDALDEQIRVVNLGVPGIRRDQFLSTEHIQFYDIRSTLLVYEKGIQKIIDTLVESAKKPPVVIPERRRLRAMADDYTATDAQVVAALADLMGQEEYDAYCKAMEWKHLNKVNSIFINAYHHGYQHKCLTAWMGDLLDLRRTYPSEPKKQIQWTNKVMALIQNNVELGNFLKWLGKKNVFFQVKVSGFRKNDELGDEDYISDSVGNIEDEAGAGAFKDFIAKTKILANEVEARYFSEGY